MFNRKLEMPAIEEPRINLHDTIRVCFDQAEGGHNIEGWTFIGAG